VLRAKVYAIGASGHQRRGRRRWACKINSRKGFRYI